MMRTSAAMPATPSTTTGIHRCLSKSTRRRPAPWRIHELRREQPADRVAEETHRQVHHEESEQEIRRRHAEEAQEGDDIVADAVLADGREDADRKGDRSTRRASVQKATSAVMPSRFQMISATGARYSNDMPRSPLECIADPAQILDDNRLVEAVADPERLERVGARRRAGGGEIGGVAGDEVARRQLDDGERDERHGEEGRDHPQEAAEDET